MARRSKDEGRRREAPFIFDQEVLAELDEGQAKREQEQAGQGQQLPGQEEGKRRRDKAPRDKGLHEKTPGEKIGPAKKTRDAQSPETTKLASAAPANVRDEGRSSVSAPGNGEKVAAYSRRMTARYGISSRGAVLVVMAVLVVVFVLLFTVLPTGVLTADGLKNGVAGFFDSLGYNLVAFSDWAAGSDRVTGISVVFFQTLVIAVVGAALALNGAVYQGAMKNALASPSTLGVMSGGVLGGTIYALVTADGASAASGGFVKASELADRLATMSVPEYLFSVYGRMIFCIAGCLAVVGLVLLISHLAGREGISKVALVIAGQVFTAIVASTCTAIKYWVLYNGSEAQFWAIQYLQTSNVSSVITFTDVLVIVIPLFIVFVIVFLYRTKLNALAFDDDEAKALGLNSTRIRNFVVILCTISTAVVVAFCGSIAYVGFLVPHLARKIVGPDFRYLIPASMLLGSIYVLLAYYIMNFTGILPGSLGTFTSVIGIVFFIVVAIVQRSRGNADWI